MENIERLEYKNLSEFLLFVLKKRPGMFLTRAKISYLSIFLTGCMVANPKDRYFDQEEGFLNWFYKEKNYDEVFFSYWTYPFLEEADGDEEKALLIYFTYLEKYLTKMK